MSDGFCTIDLIPPFLDGDEPDKAQRSLQSGIYRESCEVYEQLTGKKAPREYTPANYRLVHYGIEGCILARVPGGDGK